MSQTVYAIASGKGGVGKTTTTVNLGAMLADAGHSVVIVDTDLGMANVSGFLDFDLGETTLHDVLAGEAPVADAIYPAPGDIDVVPSDTDIEAFARSNTEKLRGVVADLREKYDFVLLDTGAGVSHDTVLPLGLADGVILVSTPDVASLSDTAKTGQLTARVDGTLTGAVLNKRASNILDAADVEETLDTRVLSVVPADDAVPMSIDAGRPLATFAPNSPAATAYRTLATVLAADDREAALAEADFDASPDPAGSALEDDLPSADDANAQPTDEPPADEAPTADEPEIVDESADESPESDPLAEPTDADGDELAEAVDAAAALEDELPDDPVDSESDEDSPADAESEANSEPAAASETDPAAEDSTVPAETSEAVPDEEPTDEDHDEQSVTDEPTEDESVDEELIEDESVEDEPTEDELVEDEPEPSENTADDADSPADAALDEPLIEEAEPRDDDSDITSDAIPFGDPDAADQDALAEEMAGESADSEEETDDESADEEASGLFGKLSGVFSR